MNPRHLAAVAGALLLVTGCGGDGGAPDDRAQRVGRQPSQGPTPTAPPAAPADLRVIAAELAPQVYGYDVAEEVTGGVVTMELINSGALRHEASLVRVGTTPVEQVRRDLSAVMDGDGPIPAYIEFYGGVAEIPGNTTASSTFTLPEGDYVLYCSVTDVGQAGTVKEPKPHYDSGMFERLRVRGTNGRSMPAVATTVTAGEYGFEFAALAPGRATVGFRNLGPAEMHLGAFLEFPVGVDEAAALATLLGEPGAGGAPVKTAVAGPFVPGGEGTFTLDLKPDRVYALICNLRDRAGGPPHLAKGMVGVFRSR